MKYILIAVVTFLLLFTITVKADWNPSEKILDIDYSNASVLEVKDDTSYIEFLNDSDQKKYLGIYYEAGTEQDREAKIYPYGDEKYLMNFRLTNAAIPNLGWPGQYKGRVQYAVGNTDTSEVFIRYSVMLPTDLIAYQYYPYVNTWFTLTSFNIGNSWQGHEHPYIVRFSIVKPFADSPSPLYFSASASNRTGGPVGGGYWADIWSRIAPYPLPLNEWIDIEMCVKVGDKNTGRLYVGVKPENTDKYFPIIDVTNWTYSPDSPEPVNISAFNPQKIYTGGKLIDFIRNVGATTNIHFDNLQMYATCGERK